MVNQHTIQNYARRIAEKFNPDKIVLFGSYAYGKPSKDSDVDLLVIMSVRSFRERPSLTIRRALDADFPMDLIVRTPQNIRQRLILGDCFIREVINKGQVLYEAADQRMADKSRKRL